MKLLLVGLCVLVAVVASPTGPSRAVLARRRLPALQHEEVHDQFGQYALRYVTGEGTVVSEQGRLVLSPYTGEPVMVFEGKTTYIAPNGKTYVTKYSAGLDGAKVEGAHLPVAPEPIHSQ